MQTNFEGMTAGAEEVDFTPTRRAGLIRLERFASRTGRHYAARRNYDLGPQRRDNVSALSPWIRHRLVSEEDVLHAVLARHSPSAAEKFIQEVFWRGYFKGWLEQRPSVWAAYQAGLDHALDNADRHSELAGAYGAALRGQTGIACFDNWARELVDTGFLHNHARMWFASIWIFTLRLPWELGADFFLRHLMDGDPASNTLSWRWVAGLHTRGKTYLARAENIAKYTEGRFAPDNSLASFAPPLEETVEHLRTPIPSASPMPEGDFILLLTEEDCTPESWLPRPPVETVAGLSTEKRSPLPIGAHARSFATGALADAAARNGAAGTQPVEADGWTDTLIRAVERTGARQIVTAYAPVGPVAETLGAIEPVLQAHGLSLHRVRRPYDDMVWPHATKGFFALKKQIPRFLGELKLTR